MADRIASYRDLHVWQDGIELIPKIYELIGRLSSSERFALADQLRRAAVSIPANIAEGQARQHRKEFIQSLCIARGSLAELDTLLVVAERLGYLAKDDSREAAEDMRKLARMLQALITSLHRPRETRSEEPD